MIRRFYATKDNTITNAFEENLTTRGTGSNMGASDILEVFSIRGQATSGSSELSRVLIQFDTDEIATSRTNGNIPASGSVNFYLKCTMLLTLEQHHEIIKYAYMLYLLPGKKVMAWIWKDILI